MLCSYSFFPLHRQLPERLIYSHCLWYLGPVHSSRHSDTDTSLRHDHQSSIVLLTKPSAFGVTNRSPTEFSPLLIYVFFLPSCLSGPSFCVVVFFFFSGGLILFFLSLKFVMSEGSLLGTLIFTFYICHPLAVTHLLLPFLPNFLKRVAFSHCFHLPQLHSATQCNLGSVNQAPSKLL